MSALLKYDNGLNVTQGVCKLHENLCKEVDGLITELHLFREISIAQSHSCLSAGYLTGYYEC